MATKCNLESLEDLYEENLCFSKDELSQVRGVRSMAIGQYSSEELNSPSYSYPNRSCEQCLKKYAFFCLL